MPRKRFDDLLVDVIKHLRNRRKLAYILDSKDPVFASADGGFSSVEGLRSEIVRRLKKFKYPYPRELGSRATFYAYVQGKGILEILLGDQLLGAVHVWLQVFDAEEKIRNLAQQKRGSAFPLAFHNGLLRAVLPSVKEATRLAFELKEQELAVTWIRDFLGAAEQQMLKDLNAIVPYSLAVEEVSLGKRAFLTSSDLAREINAELKQAFAKAGKRRTDRLGFQLTALILTPRHLVEKGELVEPEKLRKLLAYRRKVGKTA